MSVVYGEDASSCGIQKRLLQPGKGELSEYNDGTKVTFHYQTRKCDEDHTVLDDSKANGKPMELYMGKKFKLEIWEKCLKTMKREEVASFTCIAPFVATYPLVAKNLRDIRLNKADHGHHCCGMTLKEQGLGYEDLDTLLKNPEPLEFIMEILKIEEPGDFKKDVWLMSENEKIDRIPQLKEEGNVLYKENNYEQASEKYGEALGMLEQLLIREKPGDEEWIELDQKKIPFLLNYSQCKLLQGDYYPVIEHTTEVLKKDPENVKALFRRAKAHVGAWNPKEAKDDFERVAEVDSTLQKTVQKELKLLEEKQTQRDLEDKLKLQGKLFG